MRIVSFEPAARRPTKSADVQRAEGERRRVPAWAGRAREGAASSGLEALGAAGFALDDLAPFARSGRRLGALIPAGPDAGAVVDLSRALAVKLALEDAGAPEAEAESLIPPDPIAFLARGTHALASARRALDFALAALERYDAPDLRRAGAVLPRASVSLRAPVPRPGKIVGVARNYSDHTRERGDAAPPSEPVLFVKASSAVIGPEDEIEIPAAVQQADYEGELAVVIGARAHRVSADVALAAVAGYCVANDVTARDYQGVRGQRFLGKSCDTFAPLGPALVTADEIPDPQDLGLVTRLSGEVVQSARTKDMHFPVAEVIAFTSQLMRLEPGDVILTGTPGGVGAAREPARWLRDGDVVEVEIERVGRLVNYVRAER
ncbi:MAG TPA: fumarylacetoacetate hydrolase family protein [Myxococcota bacterium]|nr:fumarylacetoacetate hydrolase family protein [Myxococcota bacterium]